MSFDSIKVVLIGESGTGKTSIIQKYAYKIFDPDCTASISSLFFLYSLIQYKVFSQTDKDLFISNEVKKM